MKLPSKPGSLHDELLAEFERGRSPKGAISVILKRVKKQILRGIDTEDVKAARCRKLEQDLRYLGRIYSRVTARPPTTRRQKPRLP